MDLVASGRKNLGKSLVQWIEEKKSKVQVQPFAAAPWKVGAHCPPSCLAAPLLS